MAGINNHQAGFVATEHLVQLGCKNIGFMGYYGAVSTISDRMTGYESALALHGLGPAMAAKLGIPHRHQCHANAQLMQIYLTANLRIPDDIQLVEIADVSFAKLLPVRRSCGKYTANSI